MAYDGKLLARARARLEQQRENNRTEQARRLSEVYAKIPAVAEIDATMRAQMAQLVRVTISRAPDMQAQLAALRDANLELQMRRAELLVEAGFPMDYLDEIVSCPKCRDTGVFEGAPCECLDKLYNQELTRELGVLLQSGDECFENFDLGLYSDEYDPALHGSPRQAMEIVYAGCKRFADKFPAVSANLLLQGGTGLGKTYLSACIARAVAAKSYSVCYDSASAALDAFERQKFGRDEVQEAADARVRQMLDCDLMILDDLGTEMVTPMSLSALYTLLNTRLVGGKKIIISTNCSNEELQRRYTPQICSRLQGEFLCLPFAGTDIRLLKKK
ncbi:MAG: ATP-binding protein [Oscillospiraceae bacterium]|nr:ATP-binding protein [Oscillospiraceae bacterium]